MSRGTFLQNSLASKFSVVGGISAGLLTILGSELDCPALLFTYETLLFYLSDESFVESLRQMESGGLKYGSAMVLGALPVSVGGIVLGSFLDYRKFTSRKGRLSI